MKFSLFTDKSQGKEKKYEAAEEKNRSFDLDEKQEEKLKGLLIKAFDLAVTSKNKEIVVVLGATGSGKSTTTCYLVGCEMMEDDESGKIVVKDAKGHHHPEIGDTMDSKTLFPKVFESKIGINLSDCSGFMDNRGIPEKICSSVSIQAALSAAKSIKGIMIVIEYGSFFTQRGEGLRQLIATLSHLFYQPDNLKKSVMFVITKANDLKPEVAQKRLFDQQIPQLEGSFSNRLKEIKEDSQSLKNKFREPTLEEKEEIADLSAKLEVLKLIGKDNSIFINPLDKGEDRNKIFGMLLELKETDKNQFRFNFYDEHHIKFKRFIFKIARNGYRVCKDILEADSEIKRCNQEIKRVYVNREIHINSLTKLKHDLHQLEIGESVINTGSAGELELKQSICSCRDEIERLESEIKELKSGRTRLDEEVKELEKTKEYLEEKKLEPLWKDEMDKRGWLWAEKDFEYPFDTPYDGKPDENDFGTGKFYNTVADSGEITGKGVYHSTFKSGWFKHGKASVVLSVYRQNQSHNKTQIKDIEDRINILNNRKEKRLEKMETQIISVGAKKKNLEDALSKTLSTIQGQQRTIEQAKNGIKRTITELEALKKSDDSDIDKLNEKNESNHKNLQDNQIKLKEDLQSYQLVINSQATVEFNAAIVDDFTLEYFSVKDLFPHLFSEVPSYSENLSSSNTASSSSSSSFSSSGLLRSDSESEIPETFSSSLSLSSFSSSQTQKTDFSRRDIEIPIPPIGFESELEGEQENTLLDGTQSASSSLPASTLSLSLQDSIIKFKSSQLKPVKKLEDNKSVDSQSPKKDIEDWDGDHDDDSQLRSKNNIEKEIMRKAMEHRRTRISGKTTFEEQQPNTTAAGSLSSSTSQYSPRLTGAPASTSSSSSSSSSSALLEQGFSMS